MYLEHRLSVLLQLHLDSRLNIWLQGIRQRQAQDSTRIFEVLGFGVPYIRDLMVGANPVMNLTPHGAGNGLLHDSTKALPEPSDFISENSENSPE